MEESINYVLFDDEISPNSFKMEVMTIGNDIKNKPIKLGDLVKREDGVIGRFEAENFELIFRYEKEREDGAICSYVNLCSREYELLDV